MPSLPTVISARETTIRRSSARVCAVAPVRKLRVLPLLLLAQLGAAALAPDARAADPASVPTTTRKVVLEKGATAYHWRLTRGPVVQPSARQVLIRVRAVALNRGDLEILQYAGKRELAGLLVASDAAGDVIAVGAGVRELRAGMRVTSTYFLDYRDGAPSAAKHAAALGASVDGVLADYIVLPDTAVIAAPGGLSYEEAATLPTAGLTGWMAAVGQQPLHPGAIVLVQGTGGVSLFAMQFAAASGARIIETSSSDDKLKRTQSIAAHDSINYRSVPQWSQRVLELTHDRGADLVIDVGGKSTLGQSIHSLAYAGTLSIVGGLTGYDGQIGAGELLDKVARAQGVFVGSRADFSRMNAFIVAHHLHPVIDRILPLEQFEEALHAMASEQFVGKIVLRL
jgi:NADPH:quinone reductase-like Zn-dependent oxidoreductase